MTTKSIKNKDNKVQKASRPTSDSTLSKIINHKNRKGTLVFLVTWNKLEDIPPVWETFESINTKSNKARLRKYIKSLKPRRLGALVRTFKELVNKIMLEQ